MPDFTVDIGGLTELGKNLDRTVENIDGATKRLDDLGPDSIGPEGLDEACGDFRKDWAAYGEVPKPEILVLAGKSS